MYALELVSDEGMATVEGKLVRSFVAVPDVIYPATAGYLKELLDKPRPSEGDQLAMYYDWGIAVGGASAIDFALSTSYEDALRLSHAQRQMRNQALELLRKCFTSMLHVAVGQVPMKLRIVRTDLSTKMFRLA